MQILSRISTAAMLLGMALSGPLSATPVMVTVEPPASKEGVIWVMACTQEGYEDFRCEHIQEIQTDSEALSAQFDLPQGDWGIFLFHDANENKKMDRHWYGRPKEGVGASNNPKPRFGPPKWEAIRFEVEEAPITLSITWQGGRS